MRFHSLFCSFGSAWLGKEDNIYCFELSLETIECKLALVNNLRWWLIEINNWTDKSSQPNTFWPSTSADYAQGCSSILFPWSRTHFQFALSFAPNFQTSKPFPINIWFVEDILIMSHPPCWFAQYGPLMIGSVAPSLPPHPLLPSHNCSITSRTSLSTLPNAYNGVALFFAKERWIVQFSIKRFINWWLDTVTCLL